MAPRPVFFGVMPKPVMDLFDAIDRGEYDGQIITIGLLVLFGMLWWWLAMKGLFRRK